MKKLLFTFLAVTFTIGVMGQKVDNTSLDLNSKIVKAIVNKAVSGNSVKQFAIEKLLLLNPGVDVFPVFKTELQKMDSLIYYGDLDLEGDKKGGLQPNLLTYFEYNDNTSTHKQIIAMWDTITNSWVDYIRIKMSYNYNNTVDKAVAAIYFGGMWMDFAKANFSYDGTNVSEIDVSMLDDESLEFVDLLKVNFSYNDNMPSVVSAKVYTEDYDIWVDAAEAYFEYNDQNYIDKLTVKVADTGDVKEMVNSLQVTMEYEENMLNVQHDFAWLDSLSTWAEVAKQEYSYEDNENIHQIMSYEFDNTIGWFETGKQTFEYNNDYGFEELVLPYNFVSGFNYTGEGNMFNHMLTKTESFSKMSSKADWVKVGKVEMHYSTGNFSSVEDVQDDNVVSIFPNPADDYLIFNFTSTGDYQLVIYDITGKAVKQQPIRNGEIVQINNLKSGVYFYKINGGNFNFSGKIIKR